MARRFIEPLGLGNDGPPFGYCMTEWRDALMYDWLEHGIVICWDGRMVRHCTSLALAGSSEGNTAPGFFVSEAK